MPRTKSPAATAPAPAPTQTRWVNQQQAGDYLGVSTRTIRAYIARGLLPARRLGRSLVRIDMSDLDAMLVEIPAANARKDDAA